MNLKTSEYLAFDTKTLKQMARFPVWETLQVRYQCCVYCSCSFCHALDPFVSFELDKIK